MTADKCTLHAIVPLAVHPHQKVVGLLALERDRPQPAMAVPGQELGERPPAEPAVVIASAKGSSHHLWTTAMSVGCVEFVNLDLAW
jgi:hypothetical protein